MAKNLDTKPDVLILDEPTRGINVSAKQEIYRFVNSLRVVVMQDRRITVILEDKDINEEKIIFYATGIREGGNGNF